MLIMMWLISINKKVIYKVPVTSLVSSADTHPTIFTSCGLPVRKSRIQLEVGVGTPRSVNFSISLPVGEWHWKLNCNPGSDGLLLVQWHICSDLSDTTFWCLWLFLLFFPRYNCVTPVWCWCSLFVFINFNTPFCSWTIYYLTSTDMLHLICSVLTSSFNLSSAVWEPFPRFLLTVAPGHVTQDSDRCVSPSFSVQTLDPSQRVFQHLLSTAWFPLDRNGLYLTSQEILIKFCPVLPF